MLISSIYIYNVLYFSDPFVYFFPQKKKKYILLVFGDELVDGRNVELSTGCYWCTVSFGGIICLYCHLQQSFNEQPWLSFWYTASFFS